MKREYFMSLLAIVGITIAIAFLLHWYRDVYHLRSFYYWKSDLTLFDERAAQTAEAMNMNHLYLRFIDLGWNEYHKEITPISTLDLGKLRRQAAIQQRAQFPFDGQITPVVFIDNRALEHTDRDALEKLADNLLGKVEQIKTTLTKLGTHPGTKQGPAFTFTDALQIDCDWSPTTRDRYFLLLRELRKRAPFTDLSCTIRLAPMRHSKEFGVPPVSRGMLMCYNIGTLRDPKETNSILNVGKAAGYLRSARDYPLTLDAALPLFAWGVQFRQGEFQAVLNPLYHNQLADTSLFRPLSPTLFEVKKDTAMAQWLLREGDQVRWESVQAAQIQQMLEALKSLRHPPESVTFYHWDQALIEAQSSSAIRTWLDKF